MMAASTPTTEPAAFYAGDTVKWTKSLRDYLPADGWVLSYTLAAESDSYAVTATDNGDGTHLVSIAPATSADWRPGNYYWQASVTLGGDVYTVGEGSLTIKAQIADVKSYDGRSTAKRMLDNIDAYLGDPNNLTAAAYAIGGRSLSRWPRADLFAERSRLQVEVQSEQAAARMAAGLGNPRRLYVRFDRA